MNNDHSMLDSKSGDKNRIIKKNSYWIEIERTTRQGYVLPPNLFSLYLQFIMDEMEDLESVKFE